MKVLLLAYWQWILGAIIGLGILSSILIWSYGNKKYEEGKTFVYQQIAAAPVKRDTVWKHDSLPAPPPVIKWLKPKKVYETPPDVQAQIDSLGNDAVRLKALLAEKAKPWETEMDSARFYLHILTHPWTRENKIDLRLKSVPFQYPEITNSQIIIKDPPWWHDVLKIGGGALAGYGISRIVK